MSYDMFFLKEEISIICIQADNSPHGILEAFDRLKQKINSSRDRTFYGVSWMDEAGNIIYKAGATQSQPHEAEMLGCEEFIIRAQHYISCMVYDFKRNPAAIADTFREMLKDPRIDPLGYCVEIYLGQADVQCMVTVQWENAQGE